MALPSRYHWYDTFVGVGLAPARGVKRRADLARTGDLRTGRSERLVDCGLDRVGPRLVARLGDGDHHAYPTSGVGTLGRVGLVCRPGDRDAVAIPLVLVRDREVVPMQRIDLQGTADVSRSRDGTEVVVACEIANDRFRRCCKMSWSGSLARSA